MSTGPSRARATGRIATAVLAVAIYGPAIARSGLRTDLRVHLRFAEDLALTGSSPAPYSLFQQLTIVVRGLIPFHLVGEVVPTAASRPNTWVISGMVVLLLAVAITADLVHVRLARAVGAGHRRVAPPVIATAGTLGLLVAGPITALTWSRHQLLIGYVTPTVFHNPSYLLLRPLALALFWVVVDRLDRGAGLRGTALTFALSIVVLQAKPSYTICLLPAIVLYAAYRRARREPVALRYLALGFIVPSVAGLLVQAQLSRGQGTLQIDPLQTIRLLFASRGLSPWMALPMLLASIAFPLVVAIAYRSEVRRTPSAVLAWLTFGAGIGLVAILAIHGRTDHGDLLWGAEAAAFVLLAESIRLVIETWGRRAGGGIDRREVVVAVVLAAQVGCGLAFWLLEVASPTAWW
ncbi:hypothetical protein [Aquihabitans sp. McL0605]|uniref:hypothetical protein n=1 Tax=Aquihabitans sp. McL0605 TaxID=3415671 RepID=UPI003CEB0EBB